MKPGGHSRPKADWCVFLWNTSYAVVVNERQIPAWVREVPKPRGRVLAAAFTKLRWDKTPFFDINDQNPDRLAPGKSKGYPWVAYLDRLAARAELLDKENWSRGPHNLSALLQLLDLLPGYLLCLQRYPWIRRRLHDLFGFCAYTAVTAFNSTLGKLPSDKDQRRLALFQILRPSCATDLEAMEKIASVKGEAASLDAIRKSIKRAL